MKACDVLIVGGGPAGSTCAAVLSRAGLSVIVVDRARFPRDKVCGGWITPQVVEALGLDLSEYRQGRTCQSITGFRTGTIGGRREIDSRYDRVVSFGIRRCEFDDYLLRRSGAGIVSDAAIATIRREGNRWILNDALSAPMLVGAGGHFCPVARWLNRGCDLDGAPLVVAQETEFELSSDSDAVFKTQPDIPELYFCRDLQGYGWCCRKGRYLNVGLGRADRRSLPGAMTEFVTFLERRGRVPSGFPWRWRGHAYLLRDSTRRRVSADGVVLVGDAAGLAYAQSGEGIRPAVESGLLAAATVLDASGDYSHGRLRSYPDRLRARFGDSSGIGAAARFVPRRMREPLGALLLSFPSFVRHVALDRWFLHRDVPPLTGMPAR
jgi:flavin-dependent dehydrogenase